MSRVDQVVQAQVDTQLMEQGAYSPLELLIATARLMYADYESWRRGDIEHLDDVLMGSRRKIQDQIEAAAEYARGIGLVEEAQEFHQWDVPAASARPLRASAEAEFHRLIAVRYAPRQSALQMDLLLDNAVVALSNGIVRALATRNLSEAQRQLDRLYAQAPTHAELGAFDRLTAALARFDEAVDDAREELSFLLEIAPTAKRLLGSQSRDLLAPLWRRLADALSGRAHSDDEPSMHRSFALSHAQDWTGVSECILAEPEWPRHATLCLRLAHSGSHRRRRIEALTAWCHLCWRHTQLAVQELESGQQTDPSISAAWKRFQDGMDDALMTDDANATARFVGDFPAWMLLDEPGLAQQLPLGLATGSTFGEERYRQVHRWRHARKAVRRDEELALRKIIQASSPALFELLKRTV